MAIRIVNKKGIADTEEELFTFTESPDTTIEVGDIVLCVDTGVTYIYEYVSDSGTNAWVQYEYIDIKVKAVNPRPRSESSNFTVDGTYGIYTVNLSSNDVTATFSSASLNGEIITMKFTGEGKRFFIDMDVEGTFEGLPLPVDMDIIKDSSYAFKVVGTEIQIIN